jgi:hypothetical protein
MHGEYGAPAGRALGNNLGVMALRDPLRDRQTQPATAFVIARFIGAVEPLENMRQRGISNPGASISNSDNRAVAVCSQSDPHQPSCRRILEPVIDQRLGIRRSAGAFPSTKIFSCALSYSSRILRLSARI